MRFTDVMERGLLFIRIAFWRVSCLGFEHHVPVIQLDLKCRMYVTKALLHAFGKPGLDI